MKLERILYPKIWLLIVTLSCCIGSMYGQQPNQVMEEVDSTYIEALPGILTGRFYFSQKYTSIRLEGKEGIRDLVYWPNTTLNMGIGVTYNPFSLNLAYGFPFMNRDKEKGETRYLDLQTHVYTRHWIMDFYGQLYKGYFLLPRSLGQDDNGKYYLRPDLGVTLLGLSVFYQTNGHKFSYRAAMLQSEWQKKSSGTWLVGGEIYAGSFSADSSFIPAELTASYSQVGIEKVRFIELGPGGGYAYTLVIDKHFFIMGSATVTLDIGLSREFKEEGTSDKFIFNPNLGYRGVIGYNSHDWNVNLSIVGNRVSVKGATSSDKYIFSAGNYRLTLAKRFVPGPKLKRKLKWIKPE